MLALLFSVISLVPLDDRPVTLQLPVMLGRIAGVSVHVPPRKLLGHYLAAGDPDGVIDWLNGPGNRNAQAIVVSSDMLVYGGLVASRVPGTTSYQDAYFRMRALQQLRASHPHAWIAGFGTIMRLAPTGVPAIGAAATYFAPYPIWTYLQQYANLHDPPLPQERALAAKLREEAGPAFDAYLAVRARDYFVDRHLIDLVADGVLNRLVLGQDDAGPVGLHVKDVYALRQAVRAAGLHDRIAIEPGADELGMVLVARALARRIGWTPRIAVRYSTPEGASYQDPLEFAPIGTTIDHLIGLCGGVPVRRDPDIVLDVRVPGTPPALDDAFVAALHGDLAARRPVALADLSFLEPTYASQAAFAGRILRDGIAGRLDAYAAWNTDANTVGTALAEAVAAGAGRRSGTYDALAHRDFTFMRFLDDEAFHAVVRPQLNAALDAQGVADHTYLEPGVAARSSALDTALLWQQALVLLPQLYPNYHIAVMQITLPWNRTFETKIRVRLAPAIR
ncbi:MAG: DUF4127 family protein [Vulcanimicrobiaceae bacterium]